MFEFSFNTAEYVQLVNALLNRIDFLQSCISGLTPDKDNALYDLYSKDLSTSLSLYDKLRCY
nr:MAG TPA: hypothetical protein [Microviridae sp.]